MQNCYRCPDASQSRERPEARLHRPSEAAALDALTEFSAKWEKRYPAIIRLWENAWAEFVPFLQFDNEIRTIICTTNASRSTRGCGGR
jgi:transposase-like protein